MRFELLGSCLTLSDDWWIHVGGNCSTGNASVHESSWLRLLCRPFPCLLFFAAMSMDDAPTFSQRIAELELESYKLKFQELGIDTHSKFSYVTTYTPGADAQIFTQEVVEPIAGKEARPGVVASLRRLFIESYSMAVSDLKRKNEGVQDDVPRRLGAIELDSRRRRVEDRLIGLKLQGELDVSDRLIELCVAVWESKRLSYIPWSSCTAQSIEIRGLKKHVEWDTDERGFLKKVSQEQEEVADCSSDYKLRLVLQRRGLAMEMADLLSYDQHERLVEVLFGALMKEPKMGKLKVSREQLLEADQEVFLQLSRATRAGIRRTQDGARPLDVALPDVLCDPDFRAILHQLPALGRGTFVGGSSGSHKTTQSQGDGAGESQKSSARAVKRKARRSVGAKDDVKKVKLERGFGGNLWQKSKVREQRGQPSAPVALRDKVTTWRGQRVCYAFNLQGCNAPLVPDRSVCSRSLHVCAELGCQSTEHGLKDHGRS